MTESIQMLAQRVNRVDDTEGEAAADAMLHEIDRAHGREFVRAVLDEMSRQKKFEIAEATAEFERHKRQHAEAMHIFEGLPSTINFAEACRIKAAQGDPLAQQYVAWFNGRAFRLEEALTDAAVAVHPGWRKEADGIVTKLDATAPKFGGPLVEWFQKNYPKKAKRIEAEIDHDDAEVRS